MDAAFDLRPLRLEDYLEIWRRRKNQFLLLALAAAALGLLAVALLPDVYRSEALILLEDSRVSESYVRPVVNSDLNRELSALTQEVLSRTRLEKLIRDYQLTPVKPEVVPDSTIADLRSRIQLDVLRGAVAGERSEPHGLRVAFLAGSPELAQKVTRELVSFFVQESQRLQEEGTQETLRLLAEQTQGATQVVAEKEKQLRDFKLRYSGQLPAQERLLVETLAGLQERLQTRDQALERHRRAQTLSPGELGEAAGPEASPQERRLETLQARLAEFQSRYTPDHPDIIKTQEEIAALERELGASGPAEGAQEATGGAPRPAARPRPASLGSDASALEREKRILEREIQLYQANLKAVPVRAYQLAEMERDYEAAKEKLNLLLERQRQAELATGAARGLNGRRFLIQDYPTLPVRPYRPNRLRLSVVVLAGGFLLGLVVVGGLELRDHSLKSEKDVDFYLGLPNLATIPQWLTPLEQGRARRRQIHWVGVEGLLGLGILALLFWLYARM